MHGTLMQDDGKTILCKSMWGQPNHYQYMWKNTNKK